MSSKSSGGFLRGCLIAIAIVILIGIVFSFLFSVAIGGIAALVASEGKTTGEDSYATEFVSGNPDAINTIAVIDVKGEITRDTDSFSYAASGVANSVSIVKLIKAAVKDENVKAIIIDLDTPGGEVTASDEIYHELKLCEKPVVAMMNSLAASGGYYVACGANKIVAHRSTMTGSIGVIISSYDASELVSWAKVKPLFYTSGKMKSMLNPLKPVTEEESAVVQALVMNAYKIFAGIVSEARNIPLEKITEGELGDGRVFDGEQALANGLVDQLGYFSTAEDVALELAGLTRDDCRIERFKNESSFSDLLHMFGVKSEPVTINGLLAGSNVVLPKAGCLYYLQTGF